MADAKLMSEWEEFEGIQENFSNMSIDDDGVEDSKSLMTQNASHLDANEVAAALSERRFVPSGFPEIDREKLQQIFNEEYKVQEEKARLERIETRKKAAQQAGLQRRRMEMEQKLFEEIEELADNFQISSVIKRIKDNVEIIPTLKLDVNSVSARALAKAMWLNSSVICLDLSSNHLNDNAGAYIARILKRNNTLKKMELDNNEFGPNCARAFAESLAMNTSLIYLSLDSNPLVRTVEDKADVSGLEEFAKALTLNSTLKFLNLWRTNLGLLGGEAIANGLDGNTTILSCDVGHNAIHTLTAMRIASRLDENLAAYEANERARESDLLTEEQRQQMIQVAIDVRTVLFEYRSPFLCK